MPHRGPFDESLEKRLRKGTLRHAGTFEGKVSRALKENPDFKPRNPKQTRREAMRGVIAAMLRRKGEIS